ncbi:MAG TPA: (2Fe-2S) ferredoxin domain-containing protein [Candidatus Anammoximicrobium sp.]|nr:(2Fe-2S) ferredoxin domain-containing protein [Candidatus Anammoximicrobium sp.]
MPQLKNLEELQQLCDEIKQAERVRRETSTVITIGMGTCGIAAGARETLQAIEEELNQRQIDALVVTAGCIGVCVREPLVDIQQAGQSRIVYANVHPAMVPRLIEEHVVKGQPVKEWVVGRMPSDEPALSLCR